MKETLITFETAKLAKNKGFDFKVYKEEKIYDKLGYLLKPEDEVFPGVEYFPAPTQSLLQKWLREVHEIIVEVEVGFDIEDGEIVYYFTPFIKRKESIEFVKYSGLLTSMFENKTIYEEALELGLQGALKLIK